MEEKHWTSNFRIATPITLFVLTIFISVISYVFISQTGDIKISIAEINQRMFLHLTNAAIHIPRETVTSKDEFVIYQMMRDKQMADLKDGITRIENILEKRR